MKNENNNFLDPEHFLYLAVLYNGKILHKFSTHWEVAHSNLIITIYKGGFYIFKQSKESNRHISPEEVMPLIERTSSIGKEIYRSLSILQ